jgi:hypothetical protein
MHTLEEVKAAAKKVVEEHPHESNPITMVMGYPSCRYTDENDPGRHCIAGWVHVTLGHSIDDLSEGTAIEACFTRWDADPTVKTLKPNSPYDVESLEFLYTLQRVFDSATGQPMYHFNFEEAWTLYERVQQMMDDDPVMGVSTACTIVQNELFDLVYAQ